MEVVGGPGNAATDFARQFVEHLSYIRKTHERLGFEATHVGMRRTLRDPAASRLSSPWDVTS